MSSEHRANLHANKNMTNGEKNMDLPPHNEVRQYTVSCPHVYQSAPCSDSHDHRISLEIDAPFKLFVNWKMAVSLEENSKTVDLPSVMNVNDAVVNIRLQ
jgi:hypothetical protein